MIINVSVHAPPVVSTVLSVPRRVNVSKSSRREQTAKELIQCIYYPISPLKFVFFPTVAALLHRVCWRVRRVRPRERGVLQVGAVLAHGRGGGGVDDEHAADAEATEGRKQIRLATVSHEREFIFISP